MHGLRMNKIVLSLLLVLLSISSTHWLKRRLLWSPTSAVFGRRRINSCESWKVGEFGFRHSRTSSIKNYPLASQVIPLWLAGRAKWFRFALVCASCLGGRVHLCPRRRFRRRGSRYSPVPEAWIESTKRGSGCGFRAPVVSGNKRPGGVKTALLSDVMNRSGDFPGAFE